MIKKKEVIPKSYASFLQEIKERINKAQYDSLKFVNKEMIMLYWDIGNQIVNKQDKEAWGKSIVETLANDIQNSYPGIKGFSSRNIWRMRDFYLSYSSNPKLPSLMAEISWTHNSMILEKCKDSLEREFYIKMARKYNWTVNRISLINEYINCLNKNKKFTNFMLKLFS